MIDNGLTAWYWRELVADWRNAKEQLRHNRETGSSKLIAHCCRIVEQLTAEMSTFRKSRGWGNAN